MASKSLTRNYIEMKQRLLGGKEILIPSLSIPTENLFPTYGTTRTPQSIRSTAKSCEQSILHSSRNEPQEPKLETKHLERTIRPSTAKNSLSHRKLSESLANRVYLQNPNTLLVSHAGFTITNETFKNSSTNLFPDKKPLSARNSKNLGINAFQLQAEVNPKTFKKSDEDFKQEKFTQKPSYPIESVADNLNNQKAKSQPPVFNLPLKDNLQALLSNIPLDSLRKSSTRLFEEEPSSQRGSSSARTLISQKSGNTSAHLAKLMSPYNATRTNTPKCFSAAREKAFSRLSSFANNNHESCPPEKQEKGAKGLKQKENGEEDNLVLRLENMKIMFPTISLTPRTSPVPEHPDTKKNSFFLTPRSGRSGRNTPSSCDQSFQKDKLLLGYSEKEVVKSRKSIGQHDRKVSIRKKSRKISTLGEGLKVKEIKEPDVNDNKEDKLVNIEQRNIGMPSQMNKLFQETKEIHENINIAYRDLEIKQLGMQQALFASNDFLKVNQQMLNEIDLQVIVAEFEKKTRGYEEVNYKALDNAVKNLKFFIHLPYHLRLEILRNSSFAQFSSKQVLFREGDFGDMVYIILRGSVNVRSTKSTVFGIIADIIVTVLYDGTCFGDYAVMGTSQKNKPGTQIAPKSKFEIKEEKQSPEKYNSNLLEPPKEELLIRRKSSSYFEDPKLDESQREPRASIYQEKTQRMATIEIAESCDILCIPRKQFQNIFLRLVQKEIDDKLRVLAALPFFRDLDPFTLIPVANNLIPKVYHYKQVIISRGDAVDKLMIIARGKCGLVLQTARAFSLDPPKKIKGRMTNLRQFKVGLTDFRPQDISEPLQEKKPEKRKEEKNKTDKIDTVELKSTGSTRSFNFDKIGVINNNMVYTDNIHFGVLTEGTQFGGRSLLSDEDLFSQKFLAPRNVALDEPARLSVLADSTEVEILELDGEHMKYIPEFIQQILKNGLMNTREFDDFDVDSEIKALTEWGDLKDKNLRDVFQSIEKPYGSDYKKF